MINFGIAGFGLHGDRRLMPGFALAQKCKAIAVARRDREKSFATARQYGLAHAFASTEEMCRCPEVDAVFVTSPDVCHLADVLACIRAHKPVLVEKPMAMNPDECRQMVEAARKALVLLGVAHCFRFEESTAWLRKQVMDGGIGHVTFARAEFSYPGASHARAWLYDRAIAAGGPIADVGVHCVDALRYILLDNPVRVSAVGKRDANSGNVEAAAILTLEFSRGTLATVQVSTRAEYRCPIEVVGEEGFVRALDGLTVDHSVKLELWRDRQLVNEETVSNHLAYARQVDAFAAAIEGSASFPVSGEEGWQNQIVLDAAYRSLASGRSEEIGLLPKIRSAPDS